MCRGGFLTLLMACSSHGTVRVVPCMSVDLDTISTGTNHKRFLQYCRSVGNR